MSSITNYCSNYEHYSDRLNTKNYESFLVKPTGYVEFTSKNKPTGLEFECNMDIQLVEASCPNFFICLKYKKPDRKCLNSADWYRVLRYEGKTWVNLRVPNLGTGKNIYEVWKRNIIPYSNETYDTKFFGYVTLEKTPENFKEFYQINKFGNFEEKLQQAVLDRAGYLFFTAITFSNDQNSTSRYMFDKLLGSGQQGLVVRAVNADHPSQLPIAVKLFYSRTDDSFGHPIDLINNEILGREHHYSKDNVAKLFYGVQTISNMDALVMEYIEGTTLGDFLANNPEMSEKQREKFLECAHHLLPTKDLNYSNIMVRKRDSEDVWSFVQIDFCLYSEGDNGFKRELIDMLNKIDLSF